MTAAKQQSQTARLRIGFLLTPRFTLTAFSGFVDALRLAADDGDRSRQIDCEWAVIGQENQLIDASCGLQVMPDADMTDPGRFDYIAVVGGLLHNGQDVLPGSYSYLQAAADAGVPVIGLCTGSFILARAGLLDGYDVCLSWFHREEFCESYPDLKSRSDRMFIIDRDRLTCAGGTSVVQLAAHLIEQHCSRAQALKALRILIEEEPLPTGAWQPEAIVTHQARDQIVRAAMLRIERDLSDRLSLAEMAQELGLSPRQMERRFKADVGISAREYRQKLRLARAGWLLEHSVQPITSIALECGFSDSSHFSRSYKGHFGMSPSTARRDFLAASSARGD